MERGRDPPVGGVGKGGGICWVFVAFFWSGGDSSFICAAFE